MTRWLHAGMAALLALALCTGCRPGEADAPPGKAGTPLRIFAAASLREAMDAAATAYGDTTGQALQVTHAASSTLARQIDQGAPADVFIPADREWMDWLARRGRIGADSRRDVLGNRLVLIAPANAAAVRFEFGPGADLGPVLDAGRLAVARTDSVPAGRYAKAALQSLLLWDGVADRLAETDNVRMALMLVARGEAPLGVVYHSDAVAEPGVRVVATFPSSSHPVIVYPAARVTGSSHPQGMAFIDWLQGADAQRIFHAHGFAGR